MQNTVQNTTYLFKNFGYAGSSLLQLGFLYLRCRKLLIAVASLAVEHGL